MSNWITLEGGAEVDIENRPEGVCKSCGAKFIWGVTKNHKWIPVVKLGDKFISHFADCPGAGEILVDEDVFEGMENKKRETLYEKHLKMYSRSSSALDHGL